MPHPTQELPRSVLTFTYGGLTLCAAPSQMLPLVIPSHVGVLQPQVRNLTWFGLIRVRSPLLTESLLISFPSGT